MKARTWIVLILSALAFGLGCFNKENPLSSEDSAPTIPQLIIFRGPSSSNSPDEVNSSIGLLNGNTATGFNYLSLANLITPEANGNTYSWQVQFGQFTANIEAKKRGDGTVDWTLTLNGSDDTVTYNNWIVMRGNSHSDGSKGLWHFFSENSTSEEAQFTWEVDSHEVRFGTLDVASLSRLFDVINHPDRSGSLAIKENGAKVYEATWDESGAGSWTAWDAQGNSVDSGSWN